MSPLDLIRRTRTPTGESSGAAMSRTSRATVAERVVTRTAGILAGDHSRRRFLSRTALVGSALAVQPVSFLLRPGTAYGAVCGTCDDGWTAFCCTINSGKNSCPPDTFVAGWWKADGSAYCCGSARYIIDCNATCPTQCQCRCTGASCDGRRTCCNQFRYGQCNQQIACFGPVVCRVALCIPPWVYDASCSTTTLVSNTTANHGGACVSAECDSAITRRYYGLGGPESFLGIRTQSERSTPGGDGRYAVYQGGRLYWSRSTGAREVHGSIYTVWAAAGATTGAFGFPRTDVTTAPDGRSRLSEFQTGTIYRWSAGTFGVPDPYDDLHRRVGGAQGALGLPTAAIRRSADGRSLYLDFERGRIYRRGALTVEIHGAIFDKHEALGGIAGPLGHVQSSVLTLADGRGRATIFERGGVIYYTAATGAAGVWGDLLDAYLAHGGWASDAGYPTSDRVPVGDGRGATFTTENAQVFSTPTTGAHVVPALLLDDYRAAGGPTGSLGYPTGDPVRFVGGGMRQQFEGGVLEHEPPDHAPFVRAAYDDFLDRAPTSAELARDTDRLDRGIVSRRTFVTGLADSDEYVSTLVSQLYVDTLGRPGNASGTAFWVGEIRSGRRSIADVASAFYSSNEYFDGIGGGTNRSWIADLYTKLLGRSASSSDLDYWSAEAQSKGRGNVARRLYQSLESRRDRVQELYRFLLGRDGDEAGVTYWAGRILTEGDLSLAISLASSSEYFTRSGARFG